MARIQLLDQITIDKIAAGEVIERPSSVVKELVENAIDAGSTAITIEIKEGGIAFIRVTDNGSGIPREDLSKAFLRHSTSKIREIEDLNTIHSLGFRGEALSSIAAVSQVELLTKRPEDEVGSQYVIHGGSEKSLDDAAVKDGTTFLVRQLFYNIPARRKFLKSAITEASHISDLVTRLALSHPDVAFQFINNGSEKLHTSGNQNLKDVIYRVYGRDIAMNLLEVEESNHKVKITGYIGKPLISRGNRNFENYYINGRYVKSNIISKALEDAYKGFAMQHRYPFTALHFEIDSNEIDVNVHPTKMDLRFSEQNTVYNLVYNAILKRLNKRDMISQVEIQTPVKVVETPNVQPVKEIDYFMNKMKERVNSYHENMSSAEVIDKAEIHKKDHVIQQDKIRETIEYAKKIQLDEPPIVKEESSDEPPIVKEKLSDEPKQLNLFEEKLIDVSEKPYFRLIGQVFKTYWMIEYEEQLYIIDQHAAHEKVLYETTLKNLKNKEVTTQYISPPIVLNLSMQEKQLIEEHMTRFTDIGFELEEFGGDAYAIRGVPDNLFSIAKKELFIDMLDELSSNSLNMPAERILEKIASMSCKAAVKGNSELSATEVDNLIGQLLTLDNPFHCPHGRPTIISISKKEMEKKFKRTL